MSLEDLWVQCSGREFHLPILTPDFSHHRSSFWGGTDNIITCTHTHTNVCLAFYSDFNGNLCNKAWVELWWKEEMIKVWGLFLWDQIPHMSFLEWKSEEWVWCFLLWNGILTAFLTNFMSKFQCQVPKNVIIFLVKFFKKKGKLKWDL